MDFKRSKFGGLPRTGETKIATVFSVIFAATSARSKFSVDISMSANTGRSAFWAIGAMVVGKPTGETMISEPSGQPRRFLVAASIVRFADEPLFTMWLWR